MKLFFLSKPAQSAIQSFLVDQEDKSFSYGEVGATRAEALPSGYVVDRNSVRLGRGRETFERAAEGIRTWRPFEIPWLRLFRRGQTPAEGVTVALLIRHRFAWSLNSCRVVYTFDESTAAVRRYGFAYGTLDAHGECGEERFQVAWDRESGLVRYSLLAFSRPRHWLARLGYPFTRRLQSRFVLDSQAAMRGAASPETRGP